MLCKSMGLLIHLRSNPMLTMVKHFKVIGRWFAGCPSCTAPTLRGGCPPSRYQPCLGSGSDPDPSPAQVCDSDTRLDPMALLELVRVLDEDPQVGAVGGDVRILNPLDSWVSFLSSLRYWVAFNVERACQSYFHCVSCISGPLGEHAWGLVAWKKGAQGAEDVFRAGG